LRIGHSKAISASVNSHARIEHIEIEAPNLNQGFEKFSTFLKLNSLPWPQLLASAQDGGFCRIMLTSDDESLETLVRLTEKTTGMRKLRATLSSVSITCFGGVSSDLPHRALQILSTQNISADNYILSPHSVTLVVQPDQREAAVRAVHALI
jgi:aspartate kinase